MMDEDDELDALLAAREKQKQAILQPAQEEEESKVPASLASSSSGLAQPGDTSPAMMTLLAPMVKTMEQMHTAIGSLVEQVQSIQAKPVVEEEAAPVLRKPRKLGAVVHRDDNNLITGMTVTVIEE